MLYFNTRKKKIVISYSLLLLFGFQKHFLLSRKFIWNDHCVLFCGSKEKCQSVSCVHVKISDAKKIVSYSASCVVPQSSWLPSFCGL